jgi:hypothetical protein
MDRIGSGTSGGGARLETVTTASPMAAPSPENAISRFKARAREIKMPDDTEHQCELTKGEIKADDEPRKACGSERRRLGLPHAVTSLSSTTAASRGRDGCGEVRHPCLYSPKALRVRKGEDWALDLASAKKESDAGDGLRKGATLTSGPAVSAMGMERRRAPVSQATGWARPK